MNILERTNQPLREIIAFYEAQGYHGGAKEEDRIFLTYKNEELICVVRIAYENETPVLRGMFMREDMRGRGLGKDILRYVEPSFEKYEAPCYCIPKPNLEAFYGLIGFQKVKEHEVPPFLLERYQGYLKQGMEVILMRRGA